LAEKQKILEQIYNLKKKQILLRRNIKNLESQIQELELEDDNNDQALRVAESALTMLIETEEK